MHHEVKWILNYVDTKGDTDPDKCDGYCLYRTETGYGFNADILVSSTLPNVIWLCIHSIAQSLLNCCFESIGSRHYGVDFIEWTRQKGGLFQSSRRFTATGLKICSIFTLCCTFWSIWCVCNKNAGTYSCGISKWLYLIFIQICL